MIIEERSPGLRGGIRRLTMYLRTLNLTDPDSELQQFAMNVGRAPKRIFAAQRADQLANLLRHRGTARLATANLPRPEQTEALAMPANDRGSSHDEDPGLPILPDRTAMPQ